MNFPAVGLRPTHDAPNSGDANWRRHYRSLSRGKGETAAATSQGVCQQRATPTGVDKVVLHRQCRLPSRHSRNAATPEKYDVWSPDEPCVSGIEDILLHIATTELMHNSILSHGSCRSISQCSPVHKLGTSAIHGFPRGRGPPPITKKYKVRRSDWGESTR